MAYPSPSLGWGGLERPQTAIQYAHRYRDHYDAVLWTGADSPDALLSGFAILANRLDLAQKDDPDLSLIFHSVRDWLESHSGWLLILDNVEDPPVLRHLAPVFANGHVIMTTRMHAGGDLAERAELVKMEAEEGALLLLRRAKLIPRGQSLETASEHDRTLAEQISTEVDGLPLALDQAGAYIEETPSTLAEYFEPVSSRR
jgi:hypothetical protein